MARGDRGRDTDEEGFPHPRGDGPNMSLKRSGIERISPPTWGWPERLCPLAQRRADFPTHVGMARLQ